MTGPIDLSELLARIARLEQWAWGASLPGYLSSLQTFMPKTAITTVEPEAPSQPAGVSSDIWAKACDLWMDQGADDGAVIIANAIQRERDRACNIALRERRRHENDSDGALASTRIAAAISAGQQS